MIDPIITILLGPNDHGKSNVLAALTHLNSDTPFDADRDLSWDLEEHPDRFPHIVFEFELDSKERASLAQAENSLRAAAAADKDPATLTDAEKPISSESIPSRVTFERQGVSSALNLKKWGSCTAALSDALHAKVPRVELIQPYDKVVDTVTAPQLESNQNEFMRGIFYYAGLDPNTSTRLFTQSDRTTMEIRNASAQLDQTLKKSWSQGQNLEFVLSHNSKLEAIELKIVDPSVSTRHVRASRRSSGFTSYFAIKTILHARQKEHPAESYLLLFDEPGLYLHPAGQFDLLQVLETLAKTNQIMYVTHSLFLINKTYPTRHRLVHKGKEGTVIEGKPYVGRWGSVLSALGLSMTGTILFANYVLLSEGDSDPIYIQSILQHLIGEKIVTFDINAFAAMATGEARNADSLVRILMETEPKPKVMVLFDGDKGGADRLADIKALLEQNEVPWHRLEQGATIEDYLPLLSEVYVEAVAAYATKLAATKTGGKPSADFSADARKSFAEFQKTKKVGVAEWASTFIREKATLNSDPSKVGIAREYVLKLEAREPGKTNKRDIKKTIDLLDLIAEKLALPKPSRAEEKVLEPPSP